MITVQRSGAASVGVPGTPPTAGATTPVVDPILATITARFVDGPHFGFSDGLGAGLAPFAKRLAALGATDPTAVTPVEARTEALPSAAQTVPAPVADPGRLLEDMASWLHSPPPGIGGRERTLARAIDPTPVPAARSPIGTPLPRRDAIPPSVQVDTSALEGAGPMAAAIAAWMAGAPTVIDSAPPAAEIPSTATDSAPPEQGGHARGRARAAQSQDPDPTESVHAMAQLATPVVEIPVLRAPAEWTAADRPDASAVDAPALATRARAPVTPSHASDTPTPRAPVVQASLEQASLEQGDTDPEAASPAPEPIRTRTPAMTTRPRGPAATGTPSGGLLMPGRSRDADLRRIISSLGDALRSAASVAQDPLARATMPRASAPPAPRASASDPTAGQGTQAASDAADTAVPVVSIPTPALQAEARPDGRHADPQASADDTPAFVIPTMGEASSGVDDAGAASQTPAAGHVHAHDATPGLGDAAPTPMAQAAPAHAETVATPRIVERTVGEDLRSAHWAKAVASHLVELSHDQVDNATLRLSPEHLGPIEVHIHLQDNVVNLNFGATHADTRSTLEQALPTLREAFAGAGLSLGQATVQQEMRQGSQDRQVMAQGTVGAADELSVNSEVRRALSLVDEYA
jgi:flagellar hook-length control protein FliK